MSWSSRNRARTQQRGSPTGVAEGELRRSSETRERILHAAIASIVHDGYRNLSVAGVARRAGFTRAAAIYHFADRDALLRAAITYLIDQRLALYWEAVKDVPEGADQIAIFVDTYWDQVDSDLFIGFIELLVAARTDASLNAMLEPELERYEQERRRYSGMIFTHAMREAAGDRFETIRDVTRFLIEGLAFAVGFGRVDRTRVAEVKRFVVAQMEAAYRK